MPAIHPPAKILVTGASGFVATWIIDRLLGRGYNVRGTVRSHPKGQVLRQEFGGRFEYVVVEAMEEWDAFCDAVFGVDAIIHTAAPTTFTTNADDWIRPSVEGVLNVMRAASYSTQVKRVIMLSSIASMAPFVPDEEPPVILTRDSWNDVSYKLVQERGVHLTREQGADKAAIHMCSAAKTLSERAAWRYVQKHNPSWDFITINTARVFGPLRCPVMSPQALPGNCRCFYDVVYAGKAGTDVELISSAYARYGWIDVRDVAQVHAESLKRDEVAGERLIAAEGNYVWQDFLDAAEKIGVTLARTGDTNRGAEARHPIVFDSSASDMFDIRFRRKEETLQDVINQYRDFGWMENRMKVVAHPTCGGYIVPTS